MSLGCCGLFRRCEAWRLTLRGWLLLLILGLILVACFFLGIYPFLAVNTPFSTGPIVVEGFAGQDAFEAAAIEYRRHGSAPLIITGPSLSPNFPVTNMKNWADLGAWEMEHLGVPAEAIVKIASPVVLKDRTFASAQAVRAWMEAHGGLPPHFTLVTAAPHSRRSRLLYQRAFGSATEVGMVAAPELEYDSRQWWSYSQGVRSVVDETVAYLYARFLFWG